MSTSTSRLLALALTAALALAGCRKAEMQRIEFELPSLESGTISLADFTGRVVLVEFWATWCTPCRAQATILEDLFETFTDSEVQFLAVSLGEERDTVRSFVSKNPFQYPVLLDTEDELSGKLGIYALPTVLVIDRSGEVLFSRPGLATAATLRRVLEEAIAG